MRVGRIGTAGVTARDRRVGVRLVEITVATVFIRQAILSKSGIFTISLRR
jgi:hypothetical protein